jgi:two-component system osmolarity sensor histidine kinase EnvZ
MLLKLWPRGLLWRSFFLIATLMLVAVIAWLGMFREAELEPRARILAQTIASVTNLTRTALLTARPESRLDLLTELSDSEGVHVYPADADDRSEPPPPSALTRHLERELLERLGPETRLAFVLNDEPGLFVSFRIFSGAEGEYWLAMPRERIERRLPLRWMGWGAAVLLLALAGAWLIVYRIVRPLEEERALLLAGISHDLRTPLTRLRMEVEMSVADAAARAEMAADIAEMDGTIGQFLDFARPQGLAGKAKEPTDLAALLGEIAARYGGRANYLPGRPASAEFVMAAHPEPLRRAIVNLIENALRHAGAEHPVELELTRAGGKIVIAVLDRGPGIAPADAERLMQPFTRGEAARTGAGGAGLGLAIVDRIAQAHGGRLELRARPGGGLAARLVLPHPAG